MSSEIPPPPPTDPSLVDELRAFRDNLAAEGLKAIAELPEQDFAEAEEACGVLTDDNALQQIAAALHHRAGLQGRRVLVALANGILLAEANKP